MTLALSSGAKEGLSAKQTTPLSSWELLGHEADILGAATSAQDPNIFATCDLSGRALVWAAGEAGSAVCRNVSEVTTEGPAILDVSFVSGSLLAGAQGNNEVRVWDVTRGECVAVAHRRERHAAEAETTIQTKVAGRRRTRSGSAVQGTTRHASSPFPVLNAVTTLPASQSVCFGGDDGYVVVYDLRSGHAEWTTRLNSPVTSLAALTAHSSRRDSVCVGDACGTVHWLDMRAPRTPPTTIWLGKTAVTHLVQVCPSDGAPFDAAVALTTGTRRGAPEALWLDMRPFALCDEERVLARGLLSDSSDEEAEGIHKRCVWRGASAPGGALAFPLATSPCGAQLWRAELAGGAPHCRVCGTAMAHVSGSEGSVPTDRRLTHFVGNAHDREHPRLLLSAYGRRAMIHEV